MPTWARCWPLQRSRSAWRPSGLSPTSARPLNSPRPSNAIRARSVKSSSAPRSPWTDTGTDTETDHEALFLLPQQLVPVLGAAERLMIQSPAIIEWLEERYPTPPLLPGDAGDRAQVRALAAIVGCDIHPINNRRILEALRHRFGADEAAVNDWCGTWISAGFDAIEALLSKDPQRGDFCFGSTPTLADVYLVPQVESARRFKVDLSRWPLIQAVDAACAQLEAFRKAAPSAQQDAG